MMNIPYRPEIAPGPPGRLGLSRFYLQGHEVGSLQAEISTRTFSHRLPVGAPILPYLVRALSETTKEKHTIRLLSGSLLKHRACSLRNARTLKPCSDRWSYQYGIFRKFVEADVIDVGSVSRKT